MNKRIERGEATRAQLLEIATRLFAEHGYEGTSVDAVLRESGVSRGALYHHFAGKDALFEAVLDGVHADIGRRTLAASRSERDPVAALRAGCLAWVELTREPAVQRILLIDAPSVLGWQRWRAYDDKLVLGAMKIALTKAADQGRQPAELADLFAHVLLAAINEISQVTARAEDLDEAIGRASRAVDELLRRLLD